MIIETHMPMAPTSLPLWPMPDRQEMERAYLSSDASYDGLFFFAVRTTGVFCRPSCPSRKPKPENVEFFSTSAAAVDAGYRACLRCSPVQDREAPAWIQPLLTRMSDAPETPVRDTDLLDMGLEPGRVRRYFEARYGLSFHAYVRAQRLARSFDELRQGASIDDTVFASGFESHSGFRDAFQQLFGGAPGKAASLRQVSVMWMPTPIGDMLAGASDQGLCLLEFTEPARLEPQIKALQRQLGVALIPRTHEHLDLLRRELTEYFDGTRRAFSLPLESPGTPFEMRVWAALREIPYGETRSYSDIAAVVGSPEGVRAVGRANGRNRIAIVIPCHRVVNKSGELGGYGGGLWRKRRLLHLEQHAGQARPAPSAR